MRTILTAIALLASPLAAFAQAAPAAVAEAPIVAEARAFMTGYAADLRSGNREGLVARYDRRGVYFPTTQSRFMSFEGIGNLYRGEWGPPVSFEWKDLTFEPLGPDAIAVTGHFLWEEPRGQTALLAYTGVLVRQDGVLRIRIEHESLITSVL